MIDEKTSKLIIYGVSGVITTIISFVTFKLFLHFMQYILAFSASWLIAVSFSYLATRKKVYDSKTNGKKEMLFEYIKFILGRIFTYIVNLILLLVAVEVLRLDKFYSNMVITIVVIILNYFVGDLMINKFKFGRGK